MLGIAHAAVQTGLQRVIAYSSVENTGLILAGFGVALVGAAVGDRRLVAAGLLAATLQIVAHTVAKSLLFTASRRDRGRHRRGDDLDELRGWRGGRRGAGPGWPSAASPWPGLPPTAGFVSEWFLLESLMQQFRVPGLGYRLVLAVTGAAVALTAGFAGVTFVRLVGLVVLGQPGSPRPLAAGRDYGRPGRAGDRCCSALAAWRSPRSPRWRSGRSRPGCRPVVPAPVTWARWSPRGCCGRCSPGSRSCRRPGCGSSCPPLFAAVAPAPGPLSGRRLRGCAGSRLAVGHAGSTGGTPTPRSASPTPPAGCSPAVLHTQAEVRAAAHGQRSQAATTAAGPPESRPARGDGAAHLVRLRRHRGGRGVPIPPGAAPVHGASCRLAKRLQSGRLDAYLALHAIALIAVCRGDRPVVTVQLH